MKDIVLDLEATCWSGDLDWASEIIEIGAVKIDVDGSVIDEFSAFVQPVIHPWLSTFCRGLTSITQEDVDYADTFPVVLDDFLEWCGDCRLWSWGAYDRNQLRKDCAAHSLDSKFLEGRHYNLKKAFADRLNRRKQVGFLKAMRSLSLELEGTHHRGIDDARNIGIIFASHQEWYSENASLTPH